MRMPPFVIPNEVRNLLLSVSYKTPRVARSDIFGTFARGSEEETSMTSGHKGE